MNSIVFHIRKQLAERGGSQFYRDRSIRPTSTLCGSAVTQHDVRFNDRLGESDGYQCCEQCKRIKKEAN